MSLKLAPGDFKFTRRWGTAWVGVAMPRLPHQAGTTPTTWLPMRRRPPPENGGSCKQHSSPLRA